MPGCDPIPSGSHQNYPPDAHPRKRASGAIKADQINNDFVYNTFDVMDDCAPEIHPTLELKKTLTNDPTLHQGGPLLQLTYGISPTLGDQIDLKGGYATASGYRLEIYTDNGKILHKNYDSVQTINHAKVFYDTVLTETERRTLSARSGPVYNMINGTILTNYSELPQRADSLHVHSWDSLLDKPSNVESPAQWTVQFYSENIVGRRSGPLNLAPSALTKPIYASGGVARRFSIPTVGGSIFINSLYTGSHRYDAVFSTRFRVLSSGVASIQDLVAVTQLNSWVEVYLDGAQVAGPSLEHLKANLTFTVTNPGDDTDTHLLQIVVYGLEPGNNNGSIITNLFHNDEVTFSDYQLEATPGTITNLLIPPSFREDFCAYPPGNRFLYTSPIDGEVLGLLPYHRNDVNCCCCITCADVLRPYPQVDYPYTYTPIFSGKPYPENDFDGDDEPPIIPGPVPGRGIPGNPGGPVPGGGTGGGGAGGGAADGGAGDDGFRLARPAFRSGQIDNETFRDLIQGITVSNNPNIIGNLDTVPLNGTSTGNVDPTIMYPVSAVPTAADPGEYIDPEGFDPNIIEGASPETNFTPTYPHFQGASSSRENSNLPDGTLGRRIPPYDIVDTYGAPVDWIPSPTEQVDEILRGLEDEGIMVNYPWYPFKVESGPSMPFEVEQRTGNIVAPHAEYRIPGLNITPSGSIETFPPPMPSSFNKLGILVNKDNYTGVTLTLPAPVPEDETNISQYDLIYHDIQNATDTIDAAVVPSGEDELLTKIFGKRGEKVVKFDANIPPAIAAILAGTAVDLYLQITFTDSSVYAGGRVRFPIASLLPVPGSATRIRYDIGYRTSNLLSERYTDIYTAILFDRPQPTGGVLSIGRNPYRNYDNISNSRTPIDPDLFRNDIMWDPGYVEVPSPAETNFSDINSRPPLGTPNRDSTEAVVGLGLPEPPAARNIGRVAGGRLPIEADSGGNPPQSATVTYPGTSGTGSENIPVWAIQQGQGSSVVPMPNVPVGFGEFPLRELQPSELEISYERTRNLWLIADSLGNNYYQTANGAMRCLLCFHGGPMIVSQNLWLQFSGTGISLEEFKEFLEEQGLDDLFSLPDSLGSNDGNNETNDADNIIVYDNDGFDFDSDSSASNISLEDDPDAPINTQLLDPNFFKPGTQTSPGFGDPNNNTSNNGYTDPIVNYNLTPTLISTKNVNPKAPKVMSTPTLNTNITAGLYKLVVRRRSDNVAVYSGNPIRVEYATLDPATLQTINSLRPSLNSVPPRAYKMWEDQVSAGGYAHFQVYGPTVTDIAFAGAGGETSLSGLTYISDNIVRVDIPAYASLTPPYAEVDGDMWDVKFYSDSKTFSRTRRSAKWGAVTVYNTGPSWT